MASPSDGEVHFPPEQKWSVRVRGAHLEVAGVHVPVGGAVDGPLRGELQGVDEALVLDAEGAAQLQHSLADPTGAVVHQLWGGVRKPISRIHILPYSSFMKNAQI